MDPLDRRTRQRVELENHRLGEKSGKKKKNDVTLVSCPYRVASSYREKSLSVMCRQLVNATISVMNRECR